MIILYGILAMLAVVAAICGICFVMIWWERRHPSKNYDERQQLARGKAYRVGFYVSAVWYMIALLYILFDGDTDGMILIIFMGFWTQALAFHIYCLLTHAALPWSQKPVSTIVSYGILSGFYAINIWAAQGIDSRWTDKPPVNTFLQLSLAVGFGALATMHLIQYLREKKE